MKRDVERARELGRWGQAAALGPIFAGAIAIGYFGGAWLDRRLGTEPWLALLGMALGIAAGIRELARVLRLFRKDRPSVRDRLRTKRSAAEPGLEHLTDPHRDDAH